MDNDEIMKGMGENTIKTIWRHCPVIKYQPSNKEVSLVVTRMMHDGARWQAPWHISICIPTFIYATHRYSLTSFFFFFFFACPSSRLCARLPFSPFVSESEETSLSVSAFSLLCAHTHTHVHTHAHKYRTCTDTQTPAPTETRTHTHTQPAFCCCDGSELSKHPRFLSLSLTKAAWLSLSMQVLRDCCLSALTPLSLSVLLPSFSSLYRQHLFTS